jgi:hypothetical protein
MHCYAVGLVHKDRPMFILSGKSVELIAFISDFQLEIDYCLEFDGYSGVHSRKCYWINLRLFI